MKAVQSSNNNNMPISVRPSQDERADLTQICAELRKSPAEVIGDLLTDGLDMLRSGQFGVPPTVNMIRVLRANRATFACSPPPEAERRDKREVSLHDDLQAGTTTGVSADNPPGKIEVPKSIKAHVDFAVRVCGDSMEPMVHSGEVAFFRSAEEASDGRIVCAVVDGQMMLKMFKAANGGPALLVSLNSKYKPIPWTAETRIQGLYEGKVPSPTARPKKRVRSLELVAK